MRNSAKSTTEATRKPTIRVEPQPFSLPSMRANTSRNSAPENVTRPIQSTPVAFGSRDSLTWLSVRNTASDADGHVHEEDPFPADARGDDAADDRPDRHGCAGHGAVDAEGGAALLAVERLRDERERGGEHHRPADALDAAEEVELERARGQPAGGRGDGEDDEADGEHEPAPEQVRERARGQQEGGERERVGVDHPLQVLEARVQRALDVGQRDVDDRDVQEQHEDRHADGDQGPPLALHPALLAFACSVLPRTIRTAPRLAGRPGLAGRAQRIALGYARVAPTSMTTKNEPTTRKSSHTTPAPPTPTSIWRSPWTS